MRHGIYANRFLDDDEKPLFETIIAQLYQDFVFNKSSDFMQVELVAVYFLKLGRAKESGDWDAAVRLDRMFVGGRPPGLPQLEPARGSCRCREGVSQGKRPPPAATL